MSVEELTGTSRAENDECASSSCKSSSAVIDSHVMDEIFDADSAPEEDDTIQTPLRAIGQERSVYFANSANAGGERRPHKKRVPTGYAYDADAEAAINEDGVRFDCNNNIPEVECSASTEDARPRRIRVPTGYVSNENASADDSDVRFNSNSNVDIEHSERVESNSPKRNSVTFADTHSVGEAASKGRTAFMRTRPVRHRVPTEFVRGVDIPKESENEDTEVSNFHMSPLPDGTGDGHASGSGVTVMSAV